MRDSGNIPITYNRTGGSIANICNTAPVVTPATFAINENSANGATVGTVIATDIDALDTRTFAITGGNTNGGFAINTTSGVITVANSAALDYETTPSFSLQVTATDNDLNTPKSGSATITVNLNPVNEAPVVSGIPDQTIAEGATFATIILDDYVADVDNADSQITWTYTGNTALTVSIVNRVATITIPSADWNGSETITFTAKNPGLLRSGCW